MIAKNNQQSLPNRVDEFETEPKLKKVRLRVKETIIIHLDIESQTKLNNLAAEQGLRPSNFAHLLILQGLRDEKEFNRERDIAYSKGFDAGIKHIQDVAEGLLIKEYGVKDRQELFHKGLMPPFWIVTLINAFNAIPKHMSQSSKKEVKRSNGGENDQ